MAKKSSTKKAAPKPKGSRQPRAGAAQNKKKPNGNSGPPVRVRMYRQGLGDCFLITFDVGGNEKHMLIDCGTLGATTTGIKIGDVMKHVAATTDPTSKKGKLEVLVATHAHKDHVSGFLSEQATLANFKIENVWMGWTEDPADALARKLGNTARALRAAIAGASAVPQMSQDQKANLTGMAEFEGATLQPDGSLAMGDTIAAALDVVRKFKGAALTYQKPGGPAIELPSIPGFRFYVLGPPYDADKLSNMDRNRDELYGLASALGAHNDLTDQTTDDRIPFDSRFGYPIGQADQFFPNYARADQQYRRVDDQWMRSIEALAAKLDDFRNNTSLALAIERIADGKVLLFPADAQQGNWLSWHDPAMKWAVEDAKGDVRSVTAADLLGNTVFYKVGHHSSHNATAKTLGLEIMRKNKELTAFIPVDRQVALGKSPQGSWRMPAVALYRELLEACQGRVVRADLGWADDAAAASLPKIENELLKLATPAEWTEWKAVQAKATHVTVMTTNPYFDYVLK